MHLGNVILLMGVMGSGKTTVGRALSSKLGCVFRDADEFHNAANIEKMKSGIPLTDEDRLPWLRSISSWLSETASSSKTIVMTCSALKRCYRDILRCSSSSSSSVSLSMPAASSLSTLSSSEPSTGASTSSAVSAILTIQFVHLSVPKEVLVDRLSSRAGHFMNPTLLDSQLAILEPLEPSEGGFAIHIDSKRSVEELANEIIERLSLEKNTA